LSGKRLDGDTHLIQTSAPISPGSSGGGLFDGKGNLIGITTFMLKGSQNLNLRSPPTTSLRSDIMNLRHALLQ